MSYFEEIDAWLTAIMLVTDDDQDEEQWFLRVKKQIKAKLLESYRNGQKAGIEPANGEQAEKPREAKPRKFWPPKRGSQGRQ